MRKPVLVLLVVALLSAAVESSSSYVLFRHFASVDRPFQPSGLAVGNLLNRFLKNHNTVAHTDNGYVFESDPTLGYVLHPGRYWISERNLDVQHQFWLTVDSERHRASSYTPTHASKRILLAGDSGTFGWGVNDEMTMTWLLQSRLPDYEVINLSTTSYSTILAILQLEGLKPQAGPDDILVMVYHPVTNEFNVASQMVLKPLSDGYEVQLGDGRVAETKIPFGAIDDSGRLRIERVAVDCARAVPPAGCNHPEVAQDYKYRVTELALDMLEERFKGKVIFAIVSGPPGEDPVMAHMRAKGTPIADFREARGDATNDFSPIDGHAGPFWHHMAYLKLYDEMKAQHLLSAAP